MNVVDLSLMKSFISSGSSSLDPSGHVGLIVNYQDTQLMNQMFGVTAPRWGISNSKRHGIILILQIVQFILISMII